MTVQQQPITHWIGSDRTLTFGPIVDASTGNYVSLNGASAVWCMAERPTSPVLIRKTDTDGSITFSSQTLYTIQQWSVSVVLTPADTIGLPPSLPPNVWYHELALTDSNGKISIAASGPFQLNPSITTQS